MEFILNLELRLEIEKKDETITENDDLKQILNKSLKLTNESMAVVCLIEFCQLVPNKDFECILFYSSKGLIKTLNEIKTTNIDLSCLNDEILIECLNEKYKLYKFIKYDEQKKLSNKENEIKLFDLNLMKVKSDLIDSRILFDTNLPSLIRQLNDDQCKYVITGLASLYRNIVSIGNKLKSDIKMKSLLGFRNNCLKACSESSKWTYLCEIMPEKIYNCVISEDVLSFVEHRKELFDRMNLTLETPLHLADRNKKLNKDRNQKLNEINHLDNNLQTKRYLEDYFITICDLILFYYLTIILNKCESLKWELNENHKSICSWYNRLKCDKDIIRSYLANLKSVDLEPNSDERILDETNRTTKLRNQNYHIKKLRAKLDKIDEFNFDLAIYELKSNVYLNNKIEIPLKPKKELTYEYQDIAIDWSSLNALVSPFGGGVPQKRIEGKCQQLENFLFAFKTQIYPKYKENIGDYKMTIVDFCSGGGHLAILIAYLYPDCLIKLVENKEESLDMAIKRITQLNLRNCILYKGNLTSFTGKFDLGIAIHACGTSTDLIIDKCIRSKADILISPCCYGSIKENDQIKYPRSVIYRQAFEHIFSNQSNENEPSDNYYRLANFADRTEKDLEYEDTAHLSMLLIDTDRLLYLQENNYNFFGLTKLVPMSCTTKNNFIIAKFS